MDVVFGTYTATGSRWSTAPPASFGSIDTLRHHFTRRLGTISANYRRTFRKPQ